MKEPPEPKMIYEFKNRKPMEKLFGVIMENEAKQYQCVKCRFEWKGVLTGSSKCCKCEGYMKVKA